jgi:hypothetical protein
MSVTAECRHIDFGEFLRICALVAHRTVGNHEWRTELSLSSTRVRMMAVEEKVDALGDKMNLLLAHLCVPHVNLGAPIVVEETQALETPWAMFELAVPGRREGSTQDPAGEKPTSVAGRSCFG